MTVASERGGHRPWVERVWAGEGGRLAVWLLVPPSLLYGAVTQIARWISSRTRRRLRGIKVVAIGGLAVGGAGKTTLARWAAREALAHGHRPAILLRGHGRTGGAGGGGPAEVPPMPMGGAAAAGWLRHAGDEAVAHRAALPDEVLLLVGVNRWAAATIARKRGATLIILDDGWEQDGLQYDALWVALDPTRPFGNGRTLPAGPLRRPVSNLREANALVLIAETPGEVPAAGVVTQIGAGPHPPIARFQRRIETWSFTEGTLAAVPVGGVVLVSSVGSPDRLERFLAGAGVRVLRHVAFPDHGHWDTATIAAAVEAAGDAGDRPVAIVATDKDRPRTRGLGTLGLPILIVTAGITPLDGAAPLLAVLREPSGSAPSMAPPGPIR